jgi:hypothetical protein
MVSRRQLIVGVERQTVGRTEPGASETARFGAQGAA